MVSGFLSCFELKSALAELWRATGGLEAVFDELSINLYEHVIVGDDGVYAIMHDRFRRVRGF